MLKYLNGRMSVGMLMKKIKWSYVFNASVIVICVSMILFFIFSKNGLSDLLHSAKDIAWGWLLVALICHICNAGIDCLVTWQFTRLKYKNFSMRNAIKTAIIGHFFSAVTPGGSGGQPMQVYAMRTMDVDIGFSTAMLIQKFLVYQVAATMYALVFFLTKSKFILSNINGKFMVLFVIVGFLSQLAVMFFLILACLKPGWIKKLIRLTAKLAGKILRNKNLDEKIKKADEKVDTFYNSNKQFLKAPKLLIIGFLEVVIQITFIYSIPYFIYRALVPTGTDSITLMICSVAFITVISSMIPLPGASGVSELAFSIFFGVFFTEATLKSATLIWRAITYYFTILVGAPFSILGKKKIQKEQLSDVSPKNIK